MKNVYFTFISPNDYECAKGNKKNCLTYFLFNELSSKKEIKISEVVTFYNEDFLIKTNNSNESIDLFVKDLFDTIDENNIKCVYFEGELNDSDVFYSKIYDEYKKYDKCNVYFNVKSGSPTLRECFNFIASFNNNTYVINYDKKRINTSSFFVTNNFSGSNIKSDDIYKKVKKYNLKIQNSYNYISVFELALKSGNIFNAKIIFEKYKLFNEDKDIKDALKFLFDNQYTKPNDFELDSSSKNNFVKKIKILYNKLLIYERRENYNITANIITRLRLALLYFNEFFKKMPSQNDSEIFFKNIFKTSNGEDNKKFFNRIIPYEDIPVDIKDKLENISNSLNHTDCIRQEDKDFLISQKELLKNEIESLLNKGFNKRLDYFEIIDNKIKENESITDFNHYEISNQIDLLAIIGSNDPYNNTNEPGPILSLYKYFILEKKDVCNIYLLLTKGIYDNIYFENSKLLKIKEGFLSCFKREGNGNIPNLHIIPFSYNGNTYKIENDENSLIYGKIDDFKDKENVFNVIYDFVKEKKNADRTLIVSGTGAPYFSNVMKILPSLLDDVLCFRSDYIKNYKETSISSNNYIIDSNNEISVKEVNKIYLKARFMDILEAAINDKDIVTIKIIFDLLENQGNIFNKDIKNNINDLYRIYLYDSELYSNNNLSTHKIKNMLLNYYLRYIFVENYNKNNQNKLSYDCFFGIQRLYQRLIEDKLVLIKEKYKCSDKEFSDLLYSIRVPKNNKICLFDRANNYLKGKGFIIKKYNGRSSINIQIAPQKDFDKELSYYTLSKLFFEKEHEINSIGILLYNEDILLNLTCALMIRNIYVHPNKYNVEEIVNSISRKIIHSNEEFNNIESSIARKIGELLPCIYGTYTNNKNNSKTLEKEIEEINKKFKEFENII